jgi:hypothetical protein
MGRAIIDTARRARDFRLGSWPTHAYLSVCAFEPNARGDQLLCLDLVLNLVPNL